MVVQIRSMGPMLGQSNRVALVQNGAQKSRLKAAFQIVALMQDQRLCRFQLLEPTTSSLSILRARAARDARTSSPVGSRRAVELERVGLRTSFARSSVLIINLLFRRDAILIGIAVF